MEILLFPKPICNRIHLEIIKKIQMTAPCIYILKSSNKCPRCSKLQEKKKTCHCAIPHKTTHCWSVLTCFFNSVQQPLAVLHANSSHRFSWDWFWCPSYEFLELLHSHNTYPSILSLRTQDATPQFHRLHYEKMYSSEPVKKKVLKLSCLPLSVFFTGL